MVVVTTYYSKKTISHETLFCTLLLSCFYAFSSSNPLFSMQLLVWTKKALAFFPSQASLTKGWWQLVAEPRRARWWSTPATLAEKMGKSTYPPGNHHVHPTRLEEEFLIFPAIPPVHWHANGKFFSFMVGSTSSICPFSIAVLVYWNVPFKGDMLANWRV